MRRYKLFFLFYSGSVFIAAEELMGKWKWHRSNLSTGSSGNARRCAGKGTIAREVAKRVGHSYIVPSNKIQVWSSSKTSD